MSRLVVIAALLVAAFGLDIAYEAWVPAYDGSDAASMLGLVVLIGIFALPIELVVSWTRTFSDGDR